MGFPLPATNLSAIDEIAGAALDADHNQTRRTSLSVADGASEVAPDRRGRCTRATGDRAADSGDLIVEAGTAVANTAGQTRHDITRRTPKRKGVATESTGGAGCCYGSESDRR